MFSKTDDNANLSERGYNILRHLRLYHESFHVLGYSLETDVSQGTKQFLKHFSINCLIVYVVR